MKKIFSLMTIALVCGCSSTDDNLAKYEQICINSMGICSADSGRINKCVNELRKLEEENAKVEYITEYKTEYQCCGAPGNNVRTERRVEYKNAEKQRQYEMMEYQRYQTSTRTAVAETAQVKTTGCQDTFINGRKVQRCTCGGKEPVICYEQMMNNHRVRRCEAEYLFLKRN